MALRKAVQARVILGNSIHELEIIDSLTDDWNITIDRLETAAVKIRLQSDYAGKEASSILDALTGVLSNTLPVNAFLWIELELRQDNAVTAIQELIRMIDELDDAIHDQDHAQLGLKEMKLRSQNVLSRIGELKDIFAQLQNEAQASLEGSSQKEVRA